MLGTIRKIPGSLAFAILAAAGLAVAMWTGRFPRAAAASVGSPHEARVSAHSAPPEKIRRTGPNGIVLPANVAKSLGVKTVPAIAAVHAQKLPPFQGTLALDNNLLARVHSRFAGEVEEIGLVPDAAISAAASAALRPARFMDRVEKGQLLAVVRSKDLGEKKSELIDALSKQRTDLVTLRRLQELYLEGATADRSVRDADLAVRNDRNAVDRAERTLRTWRLSEAEIAAVRAEAERLADPNAPRGAAADWARVEVRAAFSGTILEKNIAVGDIVDTSTDLFKVGDLSQLAVWAHVYEEDLPALQALPKPLAWTVNVPSRPGLAFAGTLEQVGAAIDPNQHTALIGGRVDNAAGELKIGQYVTVSVELPPAAGELEVPVDAVVEDGLESLVFVQPDAGEALFVRQPVQALRRGAGTIYVRRLPNGLQPGAQVLASGAVLLKEAFDALPAPSAN